MTEPTNQHKEEARADLVDDVLEALEREGFMPDGKDFSERRDQRLQLKAAITQRINMALSSRDAEIRAVLEGLRGNGGCWCRDGNPLEMLDHDPACLATRALWNKVSTDSTT